VTVPLLQADDLTITIGDGHDAVRVLDRVSFALDRGATLGVVGESGCGKSMTALAMMGLLPTSARVGGRLLFEGVDLRDLTAAEQRALRGRRLAMIFQEPMTALNPVVPVGVQIAETLIVHERLGTAAAQARAVGLLDRVGIAAPAERAHAFPHQMSGGMRQRVMIAMAIACHPALLIADEPTTALDVSVQAQILDLLLELQRDEGMAILFISHNLGVVSQMADEILVMYAGRAVELGPARDVLMAPRHPYTRGLIATMPDIGHRQTMLPVIDGNVPDLRRRPPGCAYAPRCPRAIADCTAGVPPFHRVAHDHDVACIRA
jgi:oligopeptide/dipeptide ABC transporter ATP-binding protein